MDKELMEASAREAERLGLQPAALLSVIEVESAGRMFSTVNGQSEPLIRFEGHWFDRRLNGPAKARARLQGIASEKAGVVKNPASQTGRWALLEKAARIDRQAALESTSWGIGQVMGGHWKWLGYASVEDLVAEARSGAIGQLRLMLRYIEKSGLVSALSRQDWKRFALGYNGPDAIRQGYDRKLAEAFMRWKRQIGHPASENPAADPGVLRPDSPPILKIGSTGMDVTDLQDSLTAHGYPAMPTGIFDQQTKEALCAFQKHAGLATDGIFGPKTRLALMGQSPSRPFWKMLETWLSLLWRTISKSI